MMAEIWDAPCAKGGFGVELAFRFRELVWGGAYSDGNFRKGM